MKLNEAFSFIKVHKVLQLWFLICDTMAGSAASLRLASMITGQFKV
jgi:hypothetical protein